MGNIGRFACVALPLVLTGASIIALLVACLAGVAGKSQSLYMFRLNTTDLSISADTISSLVSKRSDAGGFASKSGYTFHDDRFLSGASETEGSDKEKATTTTTTTSTTSTSTASTTTTASTGTNVTASDLGLGKLYDINIWGLCEVQQNGHRNCSKPEFNWASDVLNQTERHFESLAATAGKKVTFPKDITDALNAFSNVSKWTEIVFVIALVALAVELFFGFFATCSRGISCVTYLVSGIATAAVVSAASLATATTFIVVGALDADAKKYGLHASFNGKFLAAVWISAALAIGAGFCWLLTVCCCAPEHGRSRSLGGGRRARHHAGGDDAGEKLIPAGAYQPLTEPTGYNGAGQRQVPAAYGAPRFPTAAGPRADLAYEPYTHAPV